MTLAIDVTTVDGPKKDKLILYQSKSNGTISMEIEKVSEFAREIILSEQNWSCKCLGTFRIVSQKSGVADYRKEFNDQLLNNRTPSRGYANFISFAELMDPAKGFYNKSEDKGTLASDFAVEKAKTEENDNQF
ncbi:hypothetical protein niasHT_016634 [Heterodera trifolii]|uniref:Uncharacterized protein n=1 Tax=Heterodera trifolii TaxID=157864 RepID=A0ABD2LIV5_9BILA